MLPGSKCFSTNGAELEIEFVAVMKLSPKATFAVVSKEKKMVTIQLDGSN